MLQNKGLSHCRIIFILSEDDDREDFMDFFRLWNVNERIWSETDGVNIRNNSVFIVEEKHKTDIDRILMQKVEVPANNHVFVF